MEGMELICFQIIAASGGAKSAYMAAIQAAKKGEYEEAEALMKQAEEMLNGGHEPHAKMIQEEAAGTPTPVSLLLLHAEDQMMGAEQFKVLAEEMVDLYKEIDALKAGK